MPSRTPRELRDKAIVSLLCLTGIRVGALISLRVKHVNIAEKSVHQFSREVMTKFGKSIDTFFVHGFDEAESALEQWLTHLDTNELFGPDDPLFPATAVRAHAKTGFQAMGFERRHWKTSDPVRKIVRSAFDAAGVPNYGPHAFRHMLARRAVNQSSSVAELVANAQNLGHSDPLTTLRSYGQLSRERQRELITGAEENVRLEGRVTQKSARQKVRRCLDKSRSIRFPFI